MYNIRLLLIVFFTILCNIFISAYECEESRYIPGLGLTTVYCCIAEDNESYCPELGDCSSYCECATEGCCVINNDCAYDALKKNKSKPNTVASTYSPSLRASLPPAYE